MIVKTLFQIGDRVNISATQSSCVDAWGRISSTGTIMEDQTNETDEILVECDQHMASILVLPSEMQPIRKHIVIQVFDSLDSDHIGGTYKVSRRDDTPVNTEEFLKAFGSASELAKENDEWNEDDILKILSGDDWKIEYIEVIQVSY